MNKSKKYYTHELDNLPIGNGIARFNQILEEGVDCWESLLGGIIDETENFDIFRSDLDYRERNLKNIFRKINELRLSEEYKEKEATSRELIKKWMEKYEDSNWFLFVITSRKQFHMVYLFGKKLN